jgi:hypothetical protein
MSNKVRVYDLVTKKLSLIPKAELAHGMIEIYFMPLGRVWVQQSQLDANAVKGPIVHPPLSPELRNSIKERIVESLSEVCPTTLSEWEDGFRRDVNAERQIAKWFVIAERFQKFVALNQLNTAQRKEVFDLMVHCTQVPDLAAFWETFRPESLSREQVEAAIAPFETNWHGGQKLEEKKREFWETHPEVCRAVSEAKVVVAEMSGKERPYIVLFGISKVEQDRTRGQQSFSALTLKCKDEQELAFLRQLTEAVKGFTDE